jgi:hypothetical protein
VRGVLKFLYHPKWNNAEKREAIKEFNFDEA